MSNYVCICLSMPLCRFVSMSVSLSIVLSICRSIYIVLTIVLSIYLSACLSIYLPTYLLNPPSFDLSIDRSIYASATSRMRYGILTRDLTGKVLAFENGLSRFVFRKSVEHGTRIVFGV